MEEEMRPIQFCGSSTKGKAPNFFQSYTHTQFIHTSQHRKFASLSLTSLLLFLTFIDINVSLFALWACHLSHKTPTVTTALSNTPNSLTQFHIIVCCVFCGDSELLFNKFYNYIFWQLAVYLMLVSKVIFLGVCDDLKTEFLSHALQSCCGEGQLKSCCVSLTYHNLTDMAAVCVCVCKKIDWQNPPPKTPLSASQAVPCHYLTLRLVVMWVTDCIRLSSCQTKKTLTAMCRPTLNFCASLFCHQ